MKRTRIKICGLTRMEDVNAAVCEGADALGFVFYPKSPRYVLPETAQKLIEQIPPFVTKVGLFVNAPTEEVVSISKKVGLSLLQFHGDETPQACEKAAQQARLPFIRAFRVKPDTTEKDLVQFEQIYQQCHRFSGLLLDAYSEAYGGQGKAFNWSVVSKEVARRVVLSGGLNAQNVIGAINQVHPFAVDISSGVEKAKGIKDALKIRDFIQAVLKADLS